MPHDTLSAPPAAADPSAGSAPRLGRRGFVTALACGATVMGLAGVAGCVVSDPVIHGSTPPTPTAEPTPEPDVVTAATDEVGAQQLLTLISDQARSGSWEVPASFAPWCDAVAAMHETHALVLQRKDPLAGAGQEGPVWISATPSSSSVSLPDLDSALTKLSEAETGLAKNHAGRADRIDDPATALIFLSSALAAQAHRSSGVVAPVPAAVAPVRFEAGSPDQAREIVLTHLDAAIFGFETGLGQMPFADARRAPGLERLDQLRTQRDQVAAEILAASQTPQPAHAGYELPGVVGTPDEIAALWGNLELGTLQAQARLAVSLPAGSRAEVISASLVQVDQVSRWRVPLSYWPGWV